MPAAPGAIPQNAKLILNSPHAGGCDSYKDLVKISLFFFGHFSAFGAYTTPCGITRKDFEAAFFNSRKENLQ
jgi:hypothetical protein